MRRFLIPSLGLILTVALAMVIKGDRGAAMPEEMKSSIEGLRIVNRQNGKPLWSFTSQKARLSEDGKFAHLRTVEVTLPEREIALKADAGTYDMESKDLFLRDNIQARMRGYTFNTESLKLHSGRELRTDDRVIFETKYWTIEGQGLKATGEELILKDVKALFF